MMNEIFKNIKGEEYYQVSNFGNVKSLKRLVNSRHPKGRFLKERILKPVQISSGYFQVGFSKNNSRKLQLVHRLVAAKFIANPENKHCINHKDGNKSNNNLINLEWVTYHENSLHASVSGLMPRGEKHSLSKLTDKEVFAIRDIEKLTLARIAKIYNVTDTTISKIILRRTWAHL